MQVSFKRYFTIMVGLPVILVFTMICSTSSILDVEVAVIIGGAAGSNDTVTDVEVYNYIDGNEKTCPNGIAPQIPNFPIKHLIGASSVYLPDIGIYVCGGPNGQLNCYKYNPRENKR